MLHNNTQNVIHNNLHVHYYNNSIDIIKYYINNYFLNFKLFVLKNYKNKNIQNNHEDIINLKDSKLDDFSKNIIINTDWNKLRKNKNGKLIIGVSILIKIIFLILIIIHQQNSNQLIHGVIQCWLTLKDS